MEATKKTTPDAVGTSSEAKLASEALASMVDGLQATSTSNPVEDAARVQREQQQIESLQTQLGSNYNIVSVIGEGGMSVVYKAKHQTLKKTVAIKMLKSNLLNDEMNRKRFQQEAQAMSSLVHQNIVGIIDYGETGEGNPYLIMDFLDGVSLSEVIRRGGSVSVDRALNIFTQACDALEAAHSNGIVHRDIKPSNLMLVKDKQGVETVKIVDFGIAKIAQDGQESQRLTQTGDVFGSPVYMSPEQCSGQKLDERSDIYSLGCVMYETLMGVPPHQGDNVLSTLHSHMFDLPAPLSIPGVDVRLLERIDAVVSRTLEKEPSKRYQSVAHLRTDLQRLNEDAHAIVAAKTWIFRFARMRRRVGKYIREHPLKFGSIAAAIVIPMAVATYVGSTVLSFEVDTRGKPVFIPFEDRTRPVVPEPPDFQQRSRYMEFLVDERESRLGRNDPEYIKAERKISTFYMKYGYWLKAIKHLRIVYNYVCKTDGDKGIAAADVASTLGDCCLHVKDWNGAEYYYKKVIPVYFMMDYAGRNYGYVNLGYGEALRAMGKNSAALPVLQKAEWALRSSREPVGAAQANQALAALCLQQEAELPVTAVAERKAKLSQAKKYYEQALASWNNGAVGDLNVVANVNRIADVSERLAALETNPEQKRLMLQEAENEYNETIERARTIMGEDYKLLPSLMISKARNLWRQNRWPEAMAVRDQALKLSRELKGNETKGDDDAAGSS
jgi:tRNA A-37 threonylcarbamoyl transferase component Bud32/tetratricopeptide (TPR) repeat protein